MIRFAATSIEQINARVIFNLLQSFRYPGDRRIRADFQVRFYSGKPETAASSIRRLFFPLSAALNNAEVSSWFDDQENQDFSLTFYLSAIITGNHLMNDLEMIMQKSFREIWFR